MVPTVYNVNCMVWIHTHITHITHSGKALSVSEIEEQQGEREQPQKQDLKQIIPGVWDWGGVGWGAVGGAIAWPAPNI